MIRSANFNDAADIASVHISAWQESYKNIINQEYLNQISFIAKLQLREQMLANQSSENISLVGVHDGKIIGFCDGGRSRETSNEYSGEIYAIYLLEEFKGKGIGSELFSHMRNHLINNGLTPYIVRVLAENKFACKFYKKHGGKIFAKKVMRIGNEEYTEIAYIFFSKKN